MQVKHRINQFFYNIRRKDKGNSSDEEEPSRLKKKWKKNKSNQNYSQWDLIENIAADPVKEDEILNQEEIQNQIRMMESRNFASKQDAAWHEKENLVEVGGKRKSFLKRSGSLLRRSMRRNKKPVEIQSPDPLDNEDLTDIVQEINQTLVAVAIFGESSKGVDDDGSEQNFINSPRGSVSTMEDFSIKIVEVQMHHGGSPVPGDSEIETEPKPEKFALRKGLQRQASKIMSRFQRTSGSLRLKSSTSIDSLPNNTFGRRRRTASLNENMSALESKDVTAKPVKTGSFRRKMSFKKARQAMRKGASSLGKNFIHASSVMPVGYECPPQVVNYYPDYEAGYPTEFEHYYYRTQSYQPKNWDDERNLQYTRKPVSFYQHGYCYNG